MIYNYHSAGTTAAKVIAELDTRSSLHCAHIAEIFDVCRNGELYSFHSGDVISAAAAELHEPVFRDVPSYMAGWVALRNKDRSLINLAKEWAFKTLRDAA